MIKIYWWSQTRGRWFTNTFPSKNDKFFERIVFLKERKVDYVIGKEFK